MKNRKKWFPIYIDISKKNVMVFGGGRIASRRIHTLLGFAEHIFVISPELTNELKELADRKQIVWLKKTYNAEDLKGADFVLAATSDLKVNQEIYTDCKNLGIPVNNASDQTACDFQFPGIICHEEVVISFNSGGKNHKKTRKLREKVELILKTSKESENE